MAADREVQPARRPTRSPRPSRWANGETDLPYLGMDVPVEVPVALMAVAFPIVPGKSADWQAFMAELNGPRRQEFVDARRRAGVHERTFLQATPMGDLVIVTLEGEDPARSFGQMMAAKDAFTTWFLERVKAVHGVDLTVPMTEAPSKLVVDSEAAH